jgi:hypothetical protein
VGGFRARRGGADGRRLPFQSDAAAGPFLVAELGVTHVELGTLIGLYLRPGPFLALPEACSARGWVTVRWSFSVSGS